MNLSDRAMLINLSIRQWSATRHDKRASAEVANNHGSDVSMGRYNKQLLAKDALESIKRIAGAARTEHYRRTLAWAEDGSRILSSAGYFEYSTKMREYEAQWDAAVHEFCIEYPNYVAVARMRLNGLFRESEYPSVAAIRDKFAFGFNVMPLPSADDFRVNLGSAESSRIRSEIEASVQSTIDTAMREVWGRVRDVIGHMAERLRAYSVSSEGVSNPFRDSLVQNVRDLLELLPTLNLTHDPDLDAFADRIRRELTSYSADTLRCSQHARENTAAAAESILAAMEDYI